VQNASVSIVARLFLYIFLLMLAIGSAAQSRRRSWRSKPAAKLKAGDNSLEKAETAKNPPPAPAVVFEGGAQRQHFYLTVADDLELIAGQGNFRSPASRQGNFRRRPVSRSQKILFNG
jgi:hypothetical protein